MHHLPATNPVHKPNAIIAYNTFVVLPSKKVIVFFSTLILFLNLVSCTPAKNTTYFQNLQKDTTLRNLVNKNFETKIQKADLLGIAVASMSPDNTIYNAPQNTSGNLAGYLVDENGNISYIKLGLLHVEGLTKKELKAKLEKDLVQYLREAIVSVGILNRHVTMLGASGPQVLPITLENMTILDALASSGDIGEKGRTDNILVIREKDEGKEFKRLNLTDNSIFYSPYFYLQPNDIVYVEPAKVKAAKTAQIISYITAGISFALLIINQFLK
ncbi:MAG: polysaccharide biosynthesis/export family protein [Ginsengibacter sp.]